MELTKKQWKTFKISQVLTRVPIKSVSKILKAQLKGTINVVGNSAFNNGVIKKITIDDQTYIQPGGCLSYGAKGGKFFWQQKPWVATDHVHCFTSPFLTATNQVFLCTILNQLLALKGGWSSSLEANIIEEEIALVVDQSGAIDWKFMEHFVEKLKQQEWSRITKVLNFSPHSD